MKLEKKLNQVIQTTTMPFIGIILCEALELEFAYLLAKDNSIGPISVICDQTSERFIKALKINGITEISEIPHLHSFQYESTKQICILAKVLPIKLHKSRNILKKAIYNVAQQILRYADCIFLGYGICGTGNTNSGFLMDFEKPVFTLNKENNPVDDCIGLALGGRKRYYAEQCKNPGTFYLTAGWTYHWRGMLEKDSNESEHNAIKKLFIKYKRALLIKSSLMTEIEMKNNITDLIKLLNLSVETQNGTLDLLTESWNSVIEYIKGL